MNGEESKKTTIDDILIALQKSFSRVSSQTNITRTKMPESACAIIIGTVEFELNLAVEPSKKNDNSNYDENDYDKLYYARNGGINIKLRGTLQTDLRTDQDT